MATIHQTVLITGSSGGFGMYLAHAFAQAEYGVVLHGRNEQALNAVRDEIVKKTKAECHIIVADLQTIEGIDDVKKALNDYGVDILINNAAINPELNRSVPLASTKEVGDIIYIDATSAIALCYAAFEHLKTSGGGIIVNINSVAGLRGSSKEALYAASKFALRGFSESVKEDWLKQGIKMIDIYPGALATGMSAARADIADLIDPKELAELLVKLCTTKSFFVKELNVRRTKV